MKETWGKFREAVRRDMHDIKRHAVDLGVPVNKIGQNALRALLEPVPVWSRTEKLHLPNKDPFNAKQWNKLFETTQQRLSDAQKQQDSDNVVRNLTLTDKATQRDCDISVVPLPRGGYNVRVMLIDSEKTEHGSSHIVVVSLDEKLPVKILYMSNDIWMVPNPEVGAAYARGIFANVRTAEVRTGQSFYQGEKSAEERSLDSLEVLQASLPPEEK